MSSIFVNHLCNAILNAPINLFLKNCNFIISCKVQYTLKLGLNNLPFNVNEHIKINTGIIDQVLFQVSIFSNFLNNYSFNLKYLPISISFSLLSSVCELKQHSIKLDLSSCELSTFDQKLSFTSAQIVLSFLSSSIFFSLKFFPMIDMR